MIKVYLLNKKIIIIICKPKTVRVEHNKQQAINTYLFVISDHHRSEERIRIYSFKK